jgi:hypothetical protein
LADLGGRSHEDDDTSATLWPANAKEYPQHQGEDRAGQVDRGRRSRAGSGDGVLAAKAIPHQGVAEASSGPVAVAIAIRSAARRKALPQFRSRNLLEEGWGTFQMHRLLFAAAAIAAIAALAASRIDGQQIRFTGDTAHRQCVASGYVPGTPLYLQCRARVVQGGATEYQEAVAR